MSRERSIPGGNSIIVVWMVVLLVAGAFAGTYSGGSGTPGDPYLISTAENLNDINDHPEDFGSYFILTNDIDLSCYTGTEFNIIGSFLDPFHGEFDGQGYTIRNFTWDSTDRDYVGIFGWVGYVGSPPDAGVIKNVSMEAVDVNAGIDMFSYYGYYVGSLAGYAHFYATITNCHASGVVQGHSDVGGLVGRNHGTGSIDSSSTISHCSATGRVYAVMYAGGLVGSNAGTIEDCNSESYVESAGSAGGLVAGTDGPVTGCSSIATVRGDWSVGGFAGSNGGIISNSTASADVFGSGDVGGFVGQAYYSNGIFSCSSAGAVVGSLDFTEGYNIGGLIGYSCYNTISQCYSTANVTGRECVGGLVGSNAQCDITDCYATGSVTGTGEDSEYTGGLVGWNMYSSRGALVHCYAAGPVSGVDYVGALLGYEQSSPGAYTTCFFDQTVNPSLSGIGNVADPPDVVGETTTNMQTQSTFTGAGWDFIWETINGTDDIWAMCDGIEYPKLTWQYGIGDLDGDDDVDFYDYALFAVNWLSNSSSFTCGGSDYTGDGFVGMGDLGVFCGHWLE